MSAPNQDSYVLYEGERFRIEFYFSGKGEMPAKEYFDHAEDEVKLKLLALVKRMAETGRIFDERKFRLVDSQEKIYEFKPKDDRFFNFFYSGRKIIVTNAYHKKAQKVDKMELLKAVNFKADYELRVNGGVYYESN